MLLYQHLEVNDVIQMVFHQTTQHQKRKIKQQNYCARINKNKKKTNKKNQTKYISTNKTRLSKIQTTIKQTHKEAAANELIFSNVQPKQSRHQTQIHHTQPLAIQNDI